jgi:hypothetical protein
MSPSPSRQRQTRKQKQFHPKKYYAGLSKANKTRRRKEIAKFGALHWNDPKAYVGFKTDAVPTKESKYTAAWRKRFPTAKSLEEKAAATGVPLAQIKECFNRGMAAWRTGHRPGATEQQWGYARVHSFLLCGKTHYTTDSDLVAAASASGAGRKWFRQCAAEAK